MKDSEGLEDRLRAIYHRLTENDPTATADFAEIALPVLERRIGRKGTPWARELVWDACTSTILGFCERPQAWDPARRSLLGYLEMSAMGDFRNAIDSRRRKSGLEILFPPVELPDELRNSSAEDQWIDSVDVDDVVQQYRTVLSDPRDQAVFRLMLLGFRDDADFAKTLGVSEQPELKRRRAIKQAKDRIKKRIQRAGRDVVS